MSEESIAAAVEEAMNPETFDVLAYLDEQPIATEKITVYVNVPKSRRLHELMESRKQEVEKRAKAAKEGKATSLSLADDEAETEFDDEINELVLELEKTALNFEVQTISPKLVKSIEKHYIATQPKDDAVAEEAHNRKANADIYARAIKQVTLGNGSVDPTVWDADRLMELEDRLYPQQAARLISALYDMVNTGYIFDGSLTVDF